MNNSYLLVGIKTRNLISMIFRNGGFSVRYLFRVLFLFNASIWSHVFAYIEKRRLAKQIKEVKEVAPPVFIVGNWRTGTTYLHQLLSLDSRFITPSVFQVSVPDHFLVSRKYYFPVMSKAMSKTRPMDNVKLGFDEPQEDEYALLKLDKNTPLEGLLFPKSSNFFLLDYNFNDSKTSTSFKSSFSLFYKKLLFSANKQLLFKNPFHSYRIKELHEMYPNAKFIHIYRNPEAVVPSAIRMWDIVAQQNVLKKGWQKPSVEEVALVYKDILKRIRKQGKELLPGNYLEIKFEDFEKDPLKSIGEIYSQLQIDYSEDYDVVLKRFIFELKDYKKNKYDLEKEVQLKIREVLADELPEYYL